MNSYSTQLILDTSKSTQPVPIPPTTLSLPNASSPSPISSLPRDDVIFNLTTAQSSTRARCSFINGKLNQISINNFAGSPILNQPATNTVAMAQGFLQRYQSYTGNLLYGSLSSMLNNVTSETNVTKRVGNALLQASVFGNQTENDIIWTYLDDNGIPAPMKDIVLTYYNGYLESFLDNWQLYQTSGTPTLSSKDAIATALEAVKKFSYSAENADGTNFTISDFKVVEVSNVTLSYANYIVQTPLQSTRGPDPYTLYPSWYVGVGFDKVYPGGITGLNVRVWADTGNLSSAEPIIWKMASAADPSPNGTGSLLETNQVSTLSMLIVLPIVAVTSATTLVYLYSNKNHLPRLKRYWVAGLSKGRMAVFCIILLSLSLIVAIPIVYAPVVDASALKSEIYASSYSAINETFDAQEYQYASEISGYIQMLYADYDGIDSSNNAGPGTNYNTIMSNIVNDGYNYAGATVFSFAPGGPDSYLDSNGVSISSMDIYYATYTHSTISFVMMWTCQTANNMGFAQAWTQISDLSSDGFNSPDTSAHAFIGFQGQSPDISINSFQGYTQVAGYWIEWFYYYAVYEHESVHAALNDASNEVFGVPYQSSPLISYWAWWPGGWMGQEYDPIPGYKAHGAMEIYGSANIFISEGGPDYVSAPDINSNVPNPGDPYTSYQFSVSSTDSWGDYVAYKIFWGDGYQTTSAFSPSGQTEYFYHSYDSGYGGQYTVTVYAESLKNSWSAPSYYTVNIASAPLNWMTIQAYDLYGLQLSPNVYVDGNLVGTAPLYIQVPQGSSISVDGSTWDPYLYYWPSLAYVSSDGTSYFNAYYS